MEFEMECSSHGKELPREHNGICMEDDGHEECVEQNNVLQYH